MTMRRRRSIGTAILGGLLTASPAAAQHLAFPASSAVDQATPVRAYGLPPGSVSVIRISAVDADSQPWTTSARFPADSSGTIDTSRDSTPGGNNGRKQAGEMFSLMQATGDSLHRRRFRTNGLVPVGVSIVLEDSSGRQLDSITAERYFIGPGVTVDTVVDAGFRGHLFLPGGNRGAGVVVLGGSEGGFPDDVAALLATNGFVALSLAYFGAEGLPPELREIPLEYFINAADWLQAHERVASERIALFGTSKGAEAALLAASLGRGIGPVVAYAPSSVAWSCICAEAARSSWTFRGAPVVSVPPGVDPAYHPVPGQPLRPAVNYSYRLKHASGSTAIPVERIDAPVAVVAGMDDQLWPSYEMALAVLNRRTRTPPRSGSGRDDRGMWYAGAGHLIGKAYLPAGSTLVAGGRLETGGTPELNADAQASAWPEVLTFLAEAMPLTRQRPRSATGQ